MGREGRGAELCPISELIAQLVILQYKYEYKYDSVLHVWEKRARFLYQYREKYGIFINFVVVQ